MTALLELRSVSAAYGSVPVLWSIDLCVPERGVVALLGANGAGKTTLLRAVCNLGVRTQGEMWLSGTRFDRLATEDIARLGVAHVPQGRGTFNELTVEENLRVGAYGRRRPDPGGSPAVSAGPADRDVYAYFPILEQRRRQQAGTLSGGEQQMLAIARALMLRPRLLLLDEPSFGLAPKIVRKIFDILGTINREHGIGVLLVEQNVELALTCAGHAAVLEAGRVVKSGTASDVAHDDAIRRAYLGD